MKTELVPWDSKIMAEKREDNMWSVLTPARRSFFGLIRSRIPLWAAHANDPFKRFMAMTEKHVK